jgi:hypothetical protein
MAFNLQVDQALNGTAKAQVVVDQNGNASPLTLSSDRVGIATTSPNAQLDVAGSGDSLMIIADTTNGNRLLIGTDDQLPTFLRLRPQSGGGLAITNDGDKIGIFVRASDGKVGVGTTDPQAELDVNGGIVSSDIRLPALAQFLPVTSLFSIIVSFEQRLRSLELRGPIA